MQVTLSLLRVLLFVARPRTFALGNIPNSMAYRSIDQYPIASNVPGVLILQIDAPICFANSNYLRERYINICNIRVVNDNSLLLSMKKIFISVLNLFTESKDGFTRRKRN